MKVFILACLLTTAGTLRAAEWDFSGEMPKDCAPRPFARLVTGKGLVPAQYADRTGSPAGVEVDWCDPSASFEFKAEFIPRLDWTNAADKAAAEDPSRYQVIWDCMGVNSGKSAKHRGIQVLFVEADGRWTPKLYAGFGDQTTWVAGPSFTPKPGEVAKLSIRYRRFGRVEWSVDGAVAIQEDGRYLESLKLLDHVYKTGRATGYDPDKFDVGWLIDVCYEIGFCLTEFGQYDRALYYQDIAMQSGITDYIADYISSVVNNDEPSSLAEIEKFMTSEDVREGNLSMDEFHSFLNRRKVYYFVEMRRFDEAVAILDELKKDPAQAEWANSELEYIGEIRPE